MPLRSMQELRRRAQAGIQVCTVHGPRCKKYPDHFEIARLGPIDMELVEMIRRGRAKQGRTSSELQEEPQPCKTRKLSDDELRKRTRYADAVRDAQKRKQLPPSWGVGEFDPELAEMIHRRRLESCPQYRGLYGPEAMERYRQNVREGFGNNVPEFEEME